MKETVGQYGTPRHLRIMSSYVSNEVTQYSEGFFQQSFDIYLLGVLEV